MQCDSFEARLNEVLDARQPLSSASDLAEHIRGCAPCRELARAYEAMLVGLQQSKAPPEPAWLTRRVVGQLRQPNESSPTVSAPPHRSRVLSLPRRPVLALAAAAALVAAVGLPLLFHRGVNLAKDDQPTDNQLSAPERSPQLAEVDRPVSNGDVRRSDSRPQNQPGLVPIGGRTLTITLLDPGQLKADEWAHEVADGLEPVTKPTVGAINGFLQLWGVGDEGRRS